MITTTPVGGGVVVTVTVAVLVVLPFALVAVSMYVVVAAGATVTDPVAPLAAGAPWSMAKVVAPDTDHDKTLLAPGAMLAGLLEKLVMTGRADGGAGVEFPDDFPPPPQAVRTSIPSRPMTRL
ncbi:hypothetical protein [Geothrix sp. PMB-07]|uniref:hypothetical protein n=1 Tax=Geothrix sp. PMB-07 TaxID=3068640 RepID=UPI002740AF6E|nr:hypothetical protein [Geothrix sp. PMB-07]WLT30995.1 hypothetical protein Q9293_14855 [Geothrix sp. PMB-07]